jgi:hypothetical protein
MTKNNKVISDIESLNNDSSDEIEIQFENQDEINEWYDKNIKLKSSEELKIISAYLDYHNYKTTKINFSYDYEFEFYDLNKKELDNLNLRGESVFKLNIINIMSKFSKYFKNTIKIEVHFEEKSRREKLIIENKYCLIHDIYVLLESRKNSKLFFDIGLEYFETIHNKILDNDKKIHSSHLLDLYSTYKEKNNNLLTFFEGENGLLSEIFTMICSLNLDAFTLCKINYFTKYNDDDLELNTNIFNNIIDIKINKKFDLKEFFSVILPKNPQNNIKYSYEEFINYLKNELKINICFIENTFCESSCFDDIIINLEKKSSTYINIYKKIYTKVNNMVFDAYNQIIKHVLSKNEFKNNINIFMNNFIMNHMSNYKEKSLLGYLQEELTEQKIDEKFDTIKMSGNDTEEEKKITIKAIQNISREKDVQVNLKTNNNLLIHKDDSKKDKKSYFNEIIHHKGDVIFYF